MFWPKELGIGILALMLSDRIFIPRKKPIGKRLDRLLVYLFMFLSTNLTSLQAKVTLRMLLAVSGRQKDMHKEPQI
jgi:hypothetical protein